MRYQASLDPRMALPPFKVFDGDVKALITFKPTFNAHLGSHIDELAKRWGTGIPLMGLAIASARSE